MLRTKTSRHKGLRQPRPPRSSTANQSWNDLRKRRRPYRARGGVVPGRDRLVFATAPELRDLLGDRAVVHFLELANLVRVGCGRSQATIVHGGER